MKIVALLVTVFFLAVSCRKAIDTPLAAENPNYRSISNESSRIEKKFVVNGQEIILKMILVPAVVCHSYSRGEAQKPCDIFIDLTCTLSQPVNGYVTVQVQKKNTIGPGEPEPKGSKNEASVVLNIAPNTTKFTFRTSFRNNNNMMVDENKFSINNVSYYKFTN